MFDYHLHSQYSPDSEMTMDEACRQAIKIGLDEIAFTDHIDLDHVSDDPFDMAGMERYIEDIEKMQEKYKDRLTIKKGIELGLRPKSLETFNVITETFHLDFIIGSVHIVDDMDPYLKDYYLDKTKEESYIRYYEEILKLVKAFDKFDVLGHLDYVKRYSPIKWEKGEHLYGLDIIEEIFKVLIEKKKGIEINTSGYRHKSCSPMPNIEIVKKFVQMGGKIITMGSDAHNVNDMAFSFKRAIAELKKSGINKLAKFSKRRPEFITI